MLNSIFDNKILDFKKKIKFKFFFFFVLISSFFWLVTKFSNTYKFKNDFDILWINIPDTISVKNKSDKLSLLFSATGFEIILYKFFKKNIKISIDTDVLYKNGIGNLDLENKIFEIERQLYEKNRIDEIISKNITFYFSILSRKKVLVLLNERIKFRPGFLNDYEWSLNPDSILISGPFEIIDTLKNVHTEFYERSDVYKSIDDKIKLLLNKDIKYSSNEVQLNGLVSKYSEKEFTVPIKIINLPDSVRLKLFPNYVKLKAIISLKNFNKVSEDNFEIIADYKFLNQKYSSLSLFLIKYPNRVKNINWQPKMVNYLIRK